VEIQDEDHEDDGQNNTVDVILINIAADSLSPGESSPERTYTGIFGWSNITLSYQLSCSGGFIGATCETPDPCLLVRCSGGQCKLQGDRAQCECGPGFLGDRCETVDHCHQVSCGSGTCINNADSFTCVCTDGFTGTRCQVNMDECEGVSCSGRGQCVDGTNTSRCVCDSGYTGQRCETALTQPAAASPVVGGATALAIFCLVVATTAIVSIVLWRLNARELVASDKTAS